MNNIDLSLPDLFLYEYSVIRYVPRVDREEFINIGLVMMCKRQKWLKGDVELNSERLKAIDPFVDIEKLETQTRFFLKKDVPAADLPIEEKYRWLTSVKSAVIQTSPSHPGYIKIDCNEEPREPQLFLEEEFNRLYRNLIL